MAKFLKPMSTTAPKPFNAPAKPKPPLTPKGKHMARVYSIVDLGTQPEVYMGQPRMQHKVQITWEMPQLMHDFGKGMEPRALSKRFTLSMSQKANLRKFVEAWRGEPFENDLKASEFDLRRLLGQKCWLTIAHKENEKKETTSFIFSCGMMTKEEVKLLPPPHNRPVCFLLGDGITSEVFKELPDWQKEIIMGCQEIKNAGSTTQPDSTTTAAQADAAGDDDIPF